LIDILISIAEILDILLSTLDIVDKETSLGLWVNWRKIKIQSLRDIEPNKHGLIVGCGKIEGVQKYVYIGTNISRS
jgi:hypothetical protein